MKSNNDKKRLKILLAIWGVLLVVMLVFSGALRMYILSENSANTHSLYTFFLFVVLASVLIPLEISIARHAKQTENKTIKVIFTALYLFRFCTILMAIICFLILSIAH